MMNLPCSWHQPFFPIYPHGSSYLAVDINHSFPLIQMAVLHCGVITQPSAIYYDVHRAQCIICVRHQIKDLDILSKTKLVLIYTRWMSLSVRNRTNPSALCDLWARKTTKQQASGFYRFQVRVSRKSRKAICKNMNNSFYKAVILTYL